MEQRDKALKVAVTAVVALAALMFVYYWVSWRTRKTENEVNLSEKVETTKEEHSEYAGVYSASDPVEGLNHRLAFISLNRKDDGSGFFGSAKLDTIGAAEENSSFMKCNDANVTEKDFFVKCSDPDLGQISFVGDVQKGAGGAIQASGKFLWSKDGTEITNKATTLSRTGAN